MKTRPLFQTIMIVITAALTACTQATPSIEPTAMATLPPTRPPLPTATLEPTVEPTAPPVLSISTADSGETLTLIWQSEFSADGALSAPNDVAVDSQGRVYVSVQSSKKVKQFNSDGTFAAHWSGTGPSTLGLTAGLAVDAQDNVYVSDFAAVRIVKYDSAGNFLLEWPTESPGGPASVTVDKDGFAYVDNFFRHDHHVQKFDSQGNLVAEWGETGAGNGLIGEQPEDIAVDHNNNVYVADRLNNLVQKFDTDGNFLAQFGGGSGKDSTISFQAPRGVAIDAEGNVYITDDFFLTKLDVDGNLVSRWSTDEGSDLEGAALMTFDAQGDLYILAKAEIISVTGETVNVIVVKKFHPS
jgi:tripartite motif-containing protein 71